MPLRPLLLAIPLALALPLAASAVTLQPVPWTSAGHGNPTSLGFVASGFLDCVTTDDLGFAFEGCANSAGDEFISDLPASESSTLTLSTGTFDFSADVVSEIVDNTWTVGLTGISLSTPSLGADESISFNLALSALVFAVLDVPIVGGDPTTELAFSRSALGFGPGFESDILGPGGGVGFGGVDVFLAGDRLTFVQLLSFDVTFDSAGTTSTSTTCGRSDFIDTSDCSLSMSVFRPAGVPEPRISLLLGAAVGLTGLLRRGR